MDEVLNRTKADRVLHTGCMLYEDELEQLQIMFRKQLTDLINGLLGKVVVWDIDGTLCRFKYTEDSSKRLLRCNDDNVGEYLANGYNMYSYAKPLKTMQYILKQLDPVKQYILSRSIEEIKPLKTEWLGKNFPYIKSENIYYSDTDIHKLQILTEIQESNKDSKIVFVEDTVYTLLKTEEQLVDIEVWHISNFIV